MQISYKTGGICSPSLYLNTTITVFSLASLVTGKFVPHNSVGYASSLAFGVIADRLEQRAISVKYVLF